MPDTYHFTIRKIDDPAKGASGTVVYETQRRPQRRQHPDAPVEQRSPGRQLAAPGVGLARALIESAEMECATAA